MTIEAAITLSRACAQCYTEPPKLYACAGCREIVYCSADCQKTARSLHKAVCNKPPGTTDALGLSLEDWSTICGKKGPYSEKHAQFRAIFSKNALATNEVTTTFNGKPLTQKEFAKLTGFRYRALPHATPQDLLVLCKEKISLCRGKTYSSLPSSFPVEISSNSKKGLSLIATRDINEGEILCTFGGIFLTGAAKDKENLTFSEFNNQFTFPPIAAQVPRHFGGLGFLSNDGLPNAAPARLIDQQYFPLQEILVASEDIPIGREICWDYGDHAIKYGQYFIEEETYLKVASQILSPNDLIIKRTDPIPVKYLKTFSMTTPKVFIRLHLEHLDPKQTLRLLQLGVLKLPSIELDFINTLEKIGEIRSLKKEAEVVELLQEFRVSHLYVAMAMDLFSQNSQVEIRNFLQILHNFTIYLYGSTEGTTLESNDRHKLLENFTLPEGLIEKARKLPKDLLNLLKGAMKEYYQRCGPDEELIYRLLPLTPLLE